MSYWHVKFYHLGVNNGGCILTPNDTYTAPLLLPNAIQHWAYIASPAKAVLIHLCISDVFVIYTKKITVTVSHTFQYNHTSDMIHTKMLYYLTILKTIWNVSTNNENYFRLCIESLQHYSFGSEHRNECMWIWIISRRAFMYTQTKLSNWKTLVAIGQSHSNMDMSMPASHQNKGKFDGQNA
jgi:hypothetical protein